MCVGGLCVTLGQRVAGYLAGAWGADELAAQQHVFGAGRLGEADLLDHGVEAGGAGVPGGQDRQGLRLRAGELHSVITAKGERAREKRKSISTSFPAVSAGPGFCAALNVLVRVNCLNSF